MIRTWAARAILERAAALPSRTAALDLGLALVDAQAAAESVTLPATLVAEARGRLAAGAPALPSSWAPSREWPAPFAALAARLRALLTAAEGGAAADEDAVSGLARAEASRAFLRAAAIRLAATLDDGPWREAACPVCGGAPDLASLAETGERRLLCSRCDAEWAYVRIACPFCLVTAHAELGYHPAGDGAYRLYVCGACGRYLKTVDLRRRPDACLPLERLLTLGLDAAALAAGYAGA